MLSIFNFKYTIFLDKQYKVTTGFFSENTIVVAEGEMLVEGIFKVCVPFQLFTNFLHAINATYKFQILTFLSFNFSKVEIFLKC